MPITTNINLFKETSNVPEYIPQALAKTKFFSLLLLTVTVICGIFVLIAYVVMKLQYDNQVRLKENLKIQLAAQSHKENMFLTVKSRIGVVEKVVAATKPMSQLIINAQNIADIAKLKSIVFNEQQKTLISYKADSFTDVFDMTAKIISLVSDKKVAKPELSGFSIDKNGFTVSYTYQPLW
jgi:hypothetical protein